MKGWIMQSQQHQVSWHIVIKQTELTLPCQFDAEHFHRGDQSFFNPTCGSATDIQNMCIQASLIFHPWLNFLINVQ